MPTQQTNSSRFAVRIYDFPIQGYMTRFRLAGINFSCGETLKSYQNVASYPHSNQANIVQVGASYIFLYASVSLSLLHAGKDKKIKRKEWWCISYNLRESTWKEFKRMNKISVDNLFQGQGFELNIIAFDT